MNEHSLASGKSRLATDLRVSSQEQSRVATKERLMAAEIFQICDLTRRTGRWRDLFSTRCIVSFLYPSADSGSGKKIVICNCTNTILRLMTLIALIFTSIFLYKKMHINYIIKLYIFFNLRI